MALSRRLFLGGLLASAAAPAVVKAANIMPIKAPSLVLPAWYTQFGGAVTGRMSCSEPAWQEFRQAESRLYRPYQREAIKQILFAQRYGTSNPLELERGLGKSRVLQLDYSELELRMIAQRDTRDMFNALKLNG
jgi:hypothetical protein